ncbi:MAG TPA: aminoacyl-tRNA hydrolase [Firmicutes bacterium]|nr:aminoacyl-tRNA hydrolase [Bacillota bacterium]
MKLIVGLGNPEERYRETRHNIGFRIVDMLADELQVKINKAEAHSLTGRCITSHGKLLLAKPQTYMNDSGRAVRALVDYYRIALPDLLIIYDDLDLPPGRLRVRARGSAAGHNGMRSIIHYLGTDSFARLRFGIGAVPAGWAGADYVLSKFADAECALVETACRNAVDAVMEWAAYGIDKVMAKVNARRPESQDPPSVSAEPGSANSAGGSTDAAGRSSAQHS